MNDVRDKHNDRDHVCDRQDCCHARCHEECHCGRAIDATSELAESIALKGRKREGAQNGSDAGRILEFDKGEVTFSKCSVVE
jgi:hypothetical protein